MRDIKHFKESGKELTKESIIEYKKELGEKYTLSSANSMIAALNSYLKYLGREELCVKQYKLQRKTYCSEEKELTKAEYLRLLRASEENEKLNGQTKHIRRICL